MKQLKTIITYKGKTNKTYTVVEVIANSKKQMQLYIAEAKKIILLNFKTIGFERPIVVQKNVEGNFSKTHFFEINDEGNYQITMILDNSIN